jgi:hypothetical protein
VLVIENKKKKVMIDELKKRGYDADPVKAWKIRQNRDEALVSVLVFCVVLAVGQNASELVTCRGKSNVCECVSLVGFC